MLLGREILPGLKRGGDRARGYLYLSDMAANVYLAAVPKQNKGSKMNIWTRGTAAVTRFSPCKNLIYAVARERYAA